MRSWRVISAAAALAVGLLGAEGAAACGNGDPVGAYQGKAETSEGAEVDLKLNLYCGEDGYQVRLQTSMGEFKVSKAEVKGGRLALTLDTGAALGSIELRPTPTGFAGQFELAGGRGPVELTRTGEAEPPSAFQPRLDLTAAQWREDLRFLAEELPKRHANAFSTTPRARFETAVRAVDRRLARLNGDEAYVALEQLVNLVGDGHTYIRFPPDRARLPIEITRFGQEFRVTGAGPGLERALGARVLRIGVTPITRARELALTLTPVGEHMSLREARAEAYLTTGLTLHGLGITSRRDLAAFTLQDDGGRTFSLDVTAVAAGAKLELKRAFRNPPLWMRRTEESFWCEPLAGSRTLYCAFRGYGDLRAKVQAMFKQIDATNSRRLVIDMRDNGGGDYTVGEAELIRPIAAHPDINRKGALYVLIGIQTFSAAMNNAARFADQTEAVLVGETIGEKPNSYQEPREFALPNSRLTVRVSTLWYAFKKSGENAVRPDNEIIPAWMDVKAGRDPVLDWVLAQPPP